MKGVVDEILKKQLIFLFHALSIDKVASMP
jgi:hypothetical protein